MTFVLTLIMMYNYVNKLFQAVSKMGKKYSRKTTIVNE